MKVTPVVYYKKPGYPTGADMKSRPKLLKKVPHRWSGNGVVLTALGMSLALCACAARGDTEPGGVKPGNTEPGVGEPEDTGAGGAGQDYRGKTEDGEAHKGEPYIMGLNPKLTQRAEDFVPFFYARR